MGQGTEAIVGNDQSGQQQAALAELERILTEALNTTIEAAKIQTPLNTARNTVNGAKTQ